MKNRNGNKIRWYVLLCILPLICVTMLTACGESGDNDDDDGKVSYEKTIYWLGSSVTYGARSSGYTMADKLAEDNNWKCVKEALSGTTLLEKEGEGLKSYTVRLRNGQNFSVDEDIDAFVCQISTNDSTYELRKKWGEITADNVTDESAFDRFTTYGAVEYIISYVKRVWDCPVYFYSGSYFEDSGLRSYSTVRGTDYAKLVAGVNDIAAKWNKLDGYSVKTIDLFNDEEFNSITDEQYSEYMADAVHPNKRGYTEWWTPYFYNKLSAS